MINYNHIFCFDAPKSKCIREVKAIDKNSQKQYDNIMSQIKRKESDYIDIDIDSKQDEKPKTKTRNWKNIDMCDKWGSIKDYISQYNWIKNKDKSNIETMLIQGKLNNIDFDKKNGVINKLNIVIDNKSI